MKLAIIALAFVSLTAQAQTIVTQSGNYVTSQQGSTTYITGPKTSSGPQVAVPMSVNPVTGIGQVHTPTGSYLVQRSSSGSVTVLQTSKSK